MQFLFMFHDKKNITAKPQIFDFEAQNWYLFSLVYQSLKVKVIKESRAHWFCYYLLNRKAQQVKKKI